LNAAPEPSVSTHGPRALGFWMCTALVVGNIIGVGIFAMPAALAPYGLNALTGWLVTVVGCACLAISFAGLARAFPRDDGPYAYTARAFGPGTAFIVMWCYWVSVWVGNAAIAVGVVGYVTIFVPALTRIAAMPALAALALIWLFVLINLRGVRTAGWVQLLTTVLKLLPQLAVIVLGLFVLVAHPAAYTAHVPANPPSWREVSSVSTLALFAMLGLECATIPAARVRQPERTIPRATLAGTLVAAAIFIVISVVPMLLIPQQELAAANAPYADLFARVLGGRYGELLAAFVVISGLGALNGWTLVVGEVTQSMARHGGFPGALGQENSHAAPARAFLLTGVVSSAMLLSNYTDSIAQGFTFLIVVATAGTLPLYCLGSLALLALRRRGQLGAAGARARWRAAAALAAVAYCVWVSIGIGLKPLLWTIAMGGAGVPVYLWSLHAQRRAAPLGSEAT
jgi:basic amino acid/polyamine antiporter, APA family